MRPPPGRLLAWNQDYVTVWEGDTHLGWVFFATEADSIRRTGYQLVGGEFMPLPATPVAVDAIAELTSERKETWHAAWWQEDLTLAFREPQAEVIRATRPLVRVTLSGGRTAVFQVDTGAETSCIDPDAAGRLGLAVAPLLWSRLTNDSIAVTHYAVIDNAAMPGVEVSGWKCLLCELDEIQSEGCTFDGIIGQDLLRRCAVVFEPDAVVFVAPAWLGDVYRRAARRLGTPPTIAKTTLEYTAGPCGLPRLELRRDESATDLFLVDTGADASYFPQSWIEARSLDAVREGESRKLGWMRKTRGYVLPSLDLEPWQVTDLDIWDWIGSPLATNPEREHAAALSMPPDEHEGILGMNLWRQFLFAVDGPAGMLWYTALAPDHVGTP